MRESGKGQQGKEEGGGKASVNHSYAQLLVRACIYLLPKKRISAVLTVGALCLIGTHYTCTFSDKAAGRGVAAYSSLALLVR